MHTNGKTIHVSCNADKIRDMFEWPWRPMHSAPKDKDIIIKTTYKTIRRAVWLDRKEMWIAPDGSEAYDALCWRPILQGEEVNEA